MSFVLNVYISSVIISLVFCYLYLFKFNRMVNVYKIVDKEENGELLKATLMDWIIYTVEPLIPGYNLLIGYDAFKYAVMVTDKEFLVDIFKINV